jgi:CrcB protein
MDFVYVGLGGGLGALLRYLVNRALMGAASTLHFPVATFAVNVAGCFVIGALAQIGESHTREALSPQARLFLMTGLLGGFTTFSAFGNETVSLLRGDQAVTALANIVLHILCGLGAVLAGRAAAGAVLR